MTLVSSIAEHDDRHARIIHYATQAFLAFGYAGTSVETIAIDASVSKLTIYRLFGDKASLAAEVLRNMAKTLEIACRGLLSMDTPVQECLERFGIAYVRWMNQPVGRSHNYEISRLVLEISVCHPECLRLWTREYTAIAITPLEQYIARRMECGELQGEDPIFIATQFVGSMFAASAHVAMALTAPARIAGLAPQSTTAAMEALVRRKVRLFLRGCAAESALTD